MAVGFNDLGTLMYADLVPGPLSEGPLRWVGFDISPYACAKTSVVARMMMQAAHVDEILQVMEHTQHLLTGMGTSNGGCSPVLGVPPIDATDARLHQCCDAADVCPRADQVGASTRTDRRSGDRVAQQVWFSSSWSNATHSAFRRALAAVMEEQRAGAAPLSGKVMAILNLWQVNDPPSVQLRYLLSDACRRPPLLQSRNAGHRAANLPPFVTEFVSRWGCPAAG